MFVKILFFGATADVIGAREIAESAQENESVGSVLDRLLSKYPKLADHKLLIAVNEEYSDHDRQVVEGDELAVFTAVSGG